MANAAEERKIPVFTVQKNNTILKNIFLIDSPHSLPVTSGQNDETLEPHQDLQMEESILVGRHPDCHIRLEHPSVSRFHLHIHSQPSFKKLTVTDLSSVHGTWVSGERIAPKTRVDLKEGDSLRIGGSSRVYRLYWVPLSQAYDMSNPFLPSLDLLQPMEEQDEETNDNGETVQVESAPLFGVEGVETVNESVSDLNSNLSEEDNLLVVLSGPEVGKPFDMELMNKDMQYVNFAWEGSEVLLLDKNHVLDEKEVERNLTVEEKFAEYAELIPAFEEVQPEKVQQNPAVEENLAVEVEQTDNGSFLVFENRNMQSGDSNLEVSAGGKNGNAEARVDEVYHFFEGKQSLNSTFTSSESPPPDVQHEHLREQVATSILTERLQDAGGGENTGKWNFQSHPTSPEPTLLPLPNGETYPHTDNLDFDIENQLPTCQMHPTSEKWRPPSNDVKDSAWNFWYPSPVPSPVNEDTNILTLGKHSQCLEVECVKEENDFATDIAANANESSLWSFWSGSLGLESVHSSSFSDSEFLSESESQLTRCEHSSPLMMRSAQRPYSSSSIWSRNGQSTMSAPQVRTIYTTKKVVGAETNIEGQKLEEPTGRALWNGEDQIEEEDSSPGKVNHTPRTQSSLGKLSSRVGFLDLDSGKSMMGTPQTSKKKLDAESCNEGQTVEDEPFTRALFNGVDQTEGVFSPDKENYTPNSLASSPWKLSKIRDAKDNHVEKSPNWSRTTGIEIDSENDKSPLLKKENQTLPKALSKQKSSAGHISKSGRPVKLTITVAKGEKERMPFQTLFTSSPQKPMTETSVSSGTCGRSKSRMSCKERMPFQTLFTSSPQKPMTETSVSSGTCGRSKSRMSCKDKRSQERAVRRWTMIADVTSLLNKESRKSLQLLEGIKGTQLIIPRSVMRELGFVKRQTSFFRKNNTEASLALEWLEECMFKPKQWVHVQSSAEDGSKSTAPTPPLSPNSSPFSGSCFSPTGLVQAAFGAFSPEIAASPTVEDSVLDYALSFRRLNRDEKLVLLTDHAPLKIKAMAEGLICETAGEFQGSLVNPFSERFMWGDSSPRGQTWSYLDDVVLREHFYPAEHSSAMVMNTSKKVENAKGLKLILLHNSQYKRISSVR